MSHYPVMQDSVRGAVVKVTFAGIGIEEFQLKKDCNASGLNWIELATDVIGEAALG